MFRDTKMLTVESAGEGKTILTISGDDYPLVAGERYKSKRKSGKTTKGNHFSKVTTRKMLLYGVIFNSWTVFLCCCGEFTDSFHQRKAYHPLFLEGGADLTEKSLHFLGTVL